MDYKIAMGEILEEYFEDTSAKVEDTSAKVEDTSAKEIPYVYKPLRK